jgi:hypothetical protein
MSLKPATIAEIPELTAKGACAAFPKGNCYLTMREELSVFSADQLFVLFFSSTGQPAEAPWLGWLAAAHPPLGLRPTSPAERATVQLFIDFPTRRAGRPGGVVIAPMLST